MTILQRWALGFGLLLAGCGGGPASAPENPAPNIPDTSTESLALRCSDQPEVTDGIASAVGCSFIQQHYKVKRWGEDFGHAVTLRDATGAAVAEVHFACDQWLLGVDAQGQAVIISRTTGEVRSHGSMHAGQPRSTLPADLTLPLDYTP